MAVEHDFIDTENEAEFLSFLDGRARQYWHVIASNAYSHNDQARYFALLQKDGPIEEIKSSLSSIDSNTSNL
jgi:hypothetical protein